jgi:hypothetical protein
MTVARNVRGQTSTIQCSQQPRRGHLVFATVALDDVLLTAFATNRSDSKINKPWAVYSSAERALVVGSVLQCPDLHLSRLAY